VGEACIEVKVEPGLYRHQPMRLTRAAYLPRSAVESALR
jgi:hypothetical protein